MFPRWVARQRAYFTAQLSQVLKLFRKIVGEAVRLAARELTTAQQLHTQQPEVDILADV